MRVLVSDVLEMLAAEMSVERVLQEYPQLSREMAMGERYEVKVFA